MKLHKREGKTGTSWYIGYVDRRGKSVRRVIKGIRSEANAKIAFAQFVMNYERRLLDLPTEEAITLGRILDARIRDRELADCTASWLNNLTQYRRKMVNYWGETYPFRDLDDVQIATYKQHRLGQGAAVETVRKDLTTIAAAGRLALRQGKISRLPWTKIELPCDRVGRQKWSYLHADEIQALLTFLKHGKTASMMRCNGREFPYFVKPSFSTYARVLVLLNTGMRLGESSKLKWSDIDMRNRFIRVVCSKTARSGQDAKIRYVPMNRSLQDLFAGMTVGSPEDLVFGVDENFRIKFKNALRYAGVREIRVHDLRHSAASHLVMNGSDLYTVAQILGHSTIQMTSRYAHLDMRHLHAAVDRMGMAMMGPADIPDGTDTKGDQVSNEILGDVRDTPPASSDLGAKTCEQPRSGFDRSGSSYGYPSFPVA